jgi:hypothetical protein
MALIPNRMTAEELSAVLNVAEETVKNLAKTSQLPCWKEKNKIFFNFLEVLLYFKDLEKEAAA